MISLYNTMTKQKEELANTGRTSLYTCGPTVYLDPQIGNWRAFMFYDTLSRTLKANGYDVQHVLNITDVGHLVNDDDDSGEDKLTKQAKLQRKSAWDIADSYTKSFISGMSQLNMLKPTKLPKATDHIREQIQMVEEIESKGFAYKADDGIYFDTLKLDDYGKLAGGKAVINTNYARIDGNSAKKNPQDFALWKFSSTAEKRDMEWESPWGLGFPGWHIECSAMSRKYLGTTLDIHAGGVDHIPIHHSNEIAQSEVANGVEFAKIWMHSEFIKVDGKKMSKSLGNSYTLSDLAAKGFDPLDYRMLVLQGHYRTETNFTWENLAAAQSRRHSLLNLAEKRWQGTDSSSQASGDYAAASARIRETMQDDLNTPEALAALSATPVPVSLHPQDMKDFIELLQTVDSLLGLKLMDSTPDISDSIKQMISDRNSAKSNKDYETADKLRDTLTQEGVEILDGSHGSNWQRIF